MSKEKEIAIALMLVDSENLDHILDSIHSPALLFDSRKKGVW